MKIIIIVILLSVVSFSQITIDTSKYKLKTKDFTGLSVYPGLKDKNIGDVIKVIKKNKKLKLKLDKVFLSGEMVDSLDMEGFTLTESCLVGSHVKETNLKSADMRKGDFRGALFTNSNLANTNLTDAIFDGANLIGAFFDGAKVKGASFKGCALSYSREEFKAIVKEYDINTIWIDGKPL